MMRLGWLMRIPSLMYFEWLSESATENTTRPEGYFMQMMQSMFIVPVTDDNVFPSISLILEFFLYVIAFISFVSVAILNLSVVKKLYIYLICISLFVIGCNQYKLILYKINDMTDPLHTLHSKWVTYNFTNQSHIGYWNIYLIDFIQFIPTSQFKSASVVVILPLIFCPWLIFVQYFNLMSNQVMALCYGIANLPGLCLALNLPVEAQIFTYNFAVTSFLIGIIYKLVTVCVVLPRTLSDFLADVFVVVNFNNHAAAMIEIPSVLWSLFDLSKQFLVFWLGLLITNILLSKNNFEGRPLILLLASISESVQTPLGLIGFSVMSCYGSRLTLKFIDWLVEGADFDDRNQSHGIAEGFSTLLMMISLNRSILKVTTNNFTRPVDSIDQSSTSPVGLIVLVILIISSSILEAASEFLASKLLHLTATAASLLKWKKHFFSLLLNFSVFIIPIVICYNIRGLFALDFWLVTIMGSFLMTSLHSLNSFVAYCLYLNNATLLKTGKAILQLKWEVEEVIMTLNFIVQCIEMCIAAGLVILLLSRAFSGHWNWVSLILLFVHFYFNIFERIRLGWINYNHRGMVTKKVDEMYTVSDETELSRLDDVCAICFSDLATTYQSGPVKRTICRHLFHKECLKKWLFIKHCCPMCSNDFNNPENEKMLFNSIQCDINTESDTESLSGDSAAAAAAEDIDLVSSTSPPSSIYDDKDIDLQVYQNIEDYEKGVSDSGSLTHSSQYSLECPPNDSESHSDHGEPVAVTRRARAANES